MPRAVAEERSSPISSTPSKSLNSPRTMAMPMCLTAKPTLEWDGSTVQVPTGTAGAAVMKVAMRSSWVVARCSGRAVVVSTTIADEIASTICFVSEIAILRTALLELHRELLEAQRIQAERFGGRMSAGEVLQAAAEDLRFDWLRTLSQLIG